MANIETNVDAIGASKKRRFKFIFKGVDIDALLDTSIDKLVNLFSARTCRRLLTSLKRRPMVMVKKLRKANRETPPNENVGENIFG
ncbi:hypothetical protein DITRI_Ditri08aG0036100 [Diplodiscus trichospermus]